jgi:hypothetical protein
VQTVVAPQEMKQMKIMEPVKHDVNVTSMPGRGILSRGQGPAKTADNSL